MGDANLQVTPELYADLCDAVERGVWEHDPKDGLKHTSREARAAALNVTNVLMDYGILEP